MSELGQMVSFSSNGNLSEGYLSKSTSGKGIGVIVLQEWWGLVDHIKNICDRFARAGFTAIAPDLYDGKVTKSPNEAGKFLMALNIEATEKKLKGAVAFLKNHEAVSSEKIGTIGFCMGGQLALFAATSNPEIGACINFYGIHPSVKPDYTKLSGPVLGIFAEKDSSVPKESIDQLSNEINAVGKKFEFQVYPSTNHAFFNDTRPEVYDVKASIDAWNKSLSFLKSNLS
ncbi:MAG: dienelactone hydrolase family protein [Chloroherpetonaceae bacterium]|nr:dienelactone hydrolase family protein [Chloroherpetonaceae bacterium]